MQDPQPNLELTHVDAAGTARMVDVAAKPPTVRTASARSRLRTTPDVATLIADGDTPKGDVIAVCRIAGIQAAKRTAELIPLAHQVPLSSVDIDVDVDTNSGIVTFETQARTVAGTGIEIEALVAASIASVTCYDMVKALDRGAVIEDVRITAKAGGRSGTFELDGQGSTRSRTVNEP